MSVVEIPVWGYINVDFADFGSCDHCHRPIRKSVLMQHRDTGRMITVGVACAKKIFAGSVEMPAEVAADTERTAP